jgi:glycerophosphoryl diester phosphodiesterase
MSLRLLLSKSGQGCPPEGTLPFIDHALHNGFDGVYLKTQTAADGLPYLFSEETTHRLCGEGGFFGYCDTVEQLRLDGHAIASLHSTLLHLQATAKRTFMVHIHALHPRALEATAQLLQQFHQRFPRGHLRFLLICADAPAIQTAKRRYPEMTFALYMVGVPLSYAQDAATCLADAVYLPEEFHSTTLIRDAQAKHLSVYVEGVPNTAHLHRLLSLSIDGAAGTSLLRNMDTPL